MRGSKNKFIHSVAAVILAVLMAVPYQSLADIALAADQAEKCAKTVADAAQKEKTEKVESPKVPLAAPEKDAEDKDEAVTPGQAAGTESGSTGEAEASTGASSDSSRATGSLSDTSRDTGSSSDSIKTSADIDSNDRASDWENTLPKKISKDLRTAMVQVAGSQLGYTASTTDSKASTRYGTFMGDPDLTPWDSAFVLFTLHYAKAVNVKNSKSDLPLDKDTDKWMKALKKRGLLRDCARSLQKGDIVFLKSEAAVASSVSDTKVTVIGVNTKDGKVEKSEHALKDVAGYLSLADVAPDKIEDKDADSSDDAEAADPDKTDNKDNKDKKDEEASEADDKEKAEETKDQESKDRNIDKDGRRLVSQTSQAGLVSAPGIGGFINSIANRITGANKDTEITITGKMPEGAKVEAYPVTVKVPGQNVIAAYDITIYAPAEGGGFDEWQPEEPVSVSIRNKDMSEPNDDVSKKYTIFHMDDKNAEPEQIGTASNTVTTDGSSAVSFMADSFSIYIIGEDETQEPNYVYLFVGDDGVVYYRQQVFEGGKVTEPAEPEAEGKLFRGWYNKYTPGGMGEEAVWEDPFVPFTVSGIPADSTGENTKVFTVYGKFESKANLTFYNQDGKTVERLLSRNVGSEVKLGVKDIPYTPIPSETTFYKFLGWTGSSALEDRYPVSEASAEPESSFYASEDKSFYPILLSGHWVYFNTNAAGSGVSYIEPEFLNGKDVPTAPEKPVRKGWRFDGWYDKAVGGTQVFDPDGVKQVSTYDNGLSENLTLYAHWTGQKTKVTVVWWVQNSTDKAGLANDKKTYDFIKEIEYSKVPDNNGGLTNTDIISGSTFDVSGEWFIDPADHITGDDPAGFVYNYERSDHNSVEVEGDGNTTFNIYFDRKTFVLSFRDHDFTTEKDHSQNAISSKTELARIVALYGSDLTEYWPLDRYRNEDINEGTIGKAWSWRAPEQSPSSVSNAFKAIPEMPLLNNGTLNTTVNYNGTEIEAGIVYFEHNTVSVSKATGKSHSYVELDPDADLDKVTQDYNNNVEAEDWPGVKQYIRINNKYYEHCLTQMHAFESGNGGSTKTDAYEGTNPLSSTCITRGSFFFDIDGFEQSTSSIKYYQFNGTPTQSNVTTSGNYVVSANNDARPLAVSTSRNSTLGKNRSGGNSNSSWLKYDKDISDMYHYYTRNNYTMRVMVKWGEDNPHELYKNENTPFEKDITKDFLDEKLNDYLRSDHEGKIPDYMEFTGWYTDEHLTQKITDFSKLEMPSHNLTIYAGVEYKWYVVNIDANGGVIDQSKNQTTWLWRKYGDTSLSEYNIHRDYVKKDNGNYSYTEYTRGYKDTSIRKAEYVLTADAPQEEPGLTVTPGYTYEKDAYVLVGWYELDHIEANGNKVLKDKPYVFGTAVDHSFTLVAKWRRNATYKVNYLSDAVDENGEPYAITPPEDNADYAEGSGVVIRKPEALPDGKRIKYWRLSDGSTVKVNDTIDIRDDIAVTVQDDDEGRIKKIDLTAVLEDDPGSGEVGGSASDIRHYWFFTGQDGVSDSDTLDYYRDIHTSANYSVSTPEGRKALDDAAYYVQNLSPGEELIVPSAPSDPTGQGRPFQGWYTEPELIHRYNGFGSIAAPVNTRLYASFDPGYQVTYVDNDGNMIGKQNYSRSGSAKLVTFGISYEPSDGSMMLGWSLEKNKTEPEYNYNDIKAQSLTVDGNKTLYPVTGLRKYLYFDVNGGSNYVDRVVLPADRRPAAPSDEANRPGYSFLGWFTEAQGGQQYTFGNGDQLPEHTDKLYAHWQINKQSTVDCSYKVIWWVLQDNGSYQYSNELVESNSVFVADKIDPKKYAVLTDDGRYASAVVSGRAYYILDHAADEKGNVIYDLNDDGTVKTDGRMTVEDKGSELNIYIRKAPVAKLDFDANGGSFDSAGSLPDDTSLDSNSTIWTISGITLGDDLTDKWPVTPVREGYQFAGWTTTQKGNGVRFNAGKATAELLDSVTLYAQWTKAEQKPTTDASALIYKIKVRHHLEGHTKPFDEYVDINKNTYDSIVSSGYSKDSFSSYRRLFNGYTYSDMDQVTQSDDTTGQTKNRVIAYTYDYENTQTMYRDSYAWDYLEFTTNDRNSWEYNSNSGWYFFYRTFANTYKIVSSTTIYTKSGKAITAGETFKGFAEQALPDDPYDTSTKQQSNDYFKRTATPVTAPEYHPGVISVEMYYTKDNITVPEATYNLLFKDPEGGNASVSQIKHAGDPISAAASPSNAPQYKTFSHWSDTIGGEAYTFNTMPASDVTLYAVWSGENISLTTRNTHMADTSGESYDGRSFSGNKGTELGTFKIPDPLSYLEGGVHYIFDHWSLTSGGDKVSNSDIITESGDIYAVWKRQPDPQFISVYYDRNGGDEIAAADVDTDFPGTELITSILDTNIGRYKDKTSYIAWGSPVALSANLTKQVTVNGKQKTAKLVCWTTKPDGTGEKYYPGQNIRLRSHDLVLYANYSSYRVTSLTYDMNTTDANAKLYKANVTGTGTAAKWVRTDDLMDDQNLVVTFKDYLDLTSADTAVREANTPYTVGSISDGTRFMAFRPGYEFKGWSTDPDADPSGSYIQPGTEIKVDTKDIANNVLYAIWDKVTLPVEVYEVTLGDYEHSIAMPVIEGKEGYLAEDSDKVYSPETLAETVYDARSRNGVAAAYDFGKAVPASGTVGSEQKIDFIRFYAHDNKWQYASGETVPAPESDEWTDFPEDGLRLYYYPHTIDLADKVHWVLQNDNNEFTTLSDSDYNVSKTESTSLTAGIIWSSTTELSGAVDEIHPKTGTGKKVLNGFALGAPTQAGSVSGLDTAEIKPLYLKNTVDGIVYGSIEDNGVITGGGINKGEFAIYVIYGDKKAAALTVTNTVDMSGEYSNIGDEFIVSITLEKDAGTIDSSSDAELSAITGIGSATWSIEEGKATASFTVTGETGKNSIALGNIPVGWKYTVIETKKNGYKVTGEVTTATALDDDTTVSLTNVRGATEIVPSGENKPYHTILLIAVLLLLIAAYVAYHLRHRGQDLDQSSELAEALREL